MCEVCGAYPAEEHHVFYGRGNRKTSDDNGFIVSLCYLHHRASKTGVHGGNIKLDTMLKKRTQRAYEKSHSREDFMKLIGRNYL